MTASVKRVLALVVAVLAVLALANAADADASPIGEYAVANAGRVCTTLDEYPSVPGLYGIVDAIVEETGLEPREAGAVVIWAVAQLCPEYQPLIDEAIRMEQAADTRTIGV